MRKLFSIIAAVLFAGSMFAADEVLFTQTYPGSPSAYTGSYYKKFTLTTGGYTLTYDSVNNGAKAADNWTAVRVGSKKYPSVAYISSGAIADKVTKVLINFTQISADNTNALYLEVADNATFTDAAKVTATIAKGEVVFKVASPAVDKYYRIAIDNKKGSDNGFNRFDKIEFYKAGAAVDVEAPTFSPKDEYFYDKLNVKLACETEGATIWYSTDGVDPDPALGNEEEYNPATGIDITATTEIRAYASKDSKKSSVVGKLYSKAKQYEVAEAIAATITEGTPIVVRGVVSKIDIKPSTFAKFGSANIYVKDATGAAGEFEYYTCYSLKADTFKTTSPAVDPSSTSWVSLNSVTDKAGNTVALGDTVMAFGKYKLYNKVYELTDCYLTSIIEGEGPAPIEIDIQSGVMFSAGVEEDQHFWQIQAENDDYYVTLAYVGTSTAVAGTYTEADLYDDYSYIYDYNADAKIAMVSANLVVTVNTDGTEADLAGTFVGDNGTTYSLKLHYAEPTPKTTVTVTIDDAELDTEEANEIGVMGEDATGLYVQLYIYTDEFEGSFDENDLDPQYSAVWLDDTHTAAIYTAEIEVVPADNIDNGYRVTADLLCYNNTLYKVTMIVPGEEPSAINNVENVKSNVMKAIENGHLFINVNGVRYNVNGAIVK